MHSKCPSVPISSLKSSISSFSMLGKSLAVLNPRFRQYLGGSLFAALLLLGSCGDNPKSLSLVEQVRVPVAQFFQEVNPDQAKGRVGCETFLDNKTYCQQYPLRFGTKALVRFVTISKTTQKPTLKITSLQKLSIRPQEQSVVTSFSNDKVELSFLKVKAEESFTQVLQEKGLRVQSFVYSLEIPSLDTFVSQRTTVPAFNLNYLASAKGSPNDEGYLTFYVYPDSKDESTWAGLKEQAKKNGLDASFLDLIRTQSGTNTPPRIETLTPKSGVKQGAETELSLSLAGVDNDKGAKSRLQWFVSSGEINLQRAKAIKWKKRNTSEVGGVFVVVRDLQGGSDFRFAQYLNP